MYETKQDTDPLEASFAGAEDIARLKAGMADLKAKLDGATVAAARAPLDGAKASTDTKRPFVERYLRHGNTGGVEIKAIDGTADTTGGYAVPQEIDAQIDSTLTAISPIRGIANVVSVGSSGYRKLVTVGGVSSGWAAEDATRADTPTPTFAEIVPAFGDLFANPAATQAMLDDAAFDVEAWLAGEIATEFARAEGAAFVGGDGVNKPRGFLTAPSTAQIDGVRPFGTLQYLATGVSGDFPASDPQDTLIDLVQSLRSPYRQGAVFVMNSFTLAILRKMKTSDGAFIWQPGLVDKQPDTLLGYPVIEAEDMPDIGAGTTPIAFGNFKAGYLIAEREETAILRDPFTAKPYVHFYATTRIDALLQATVEAVAVNDPPATPLSGQCWVVGAAPTGAWAGQTGSIAAWTDGGWRFVAPQVATTVWSRADTLFARYDGSHWILGEIVAARVTVGGVQVVGTQQPAVASPTGGSVVDVEARTAVAAVLAVLKSHGLTA